MNLAPRPHDLLWGFTPEQLPSTAPEWAVIAMAAGEPVVVRRDEAKPGFIAVGLRGRKREERLAAWMAMDCITRSCSPEQLVSIAERSPTASPALMTLIAVKPYLDATGLVWGVTGSAGFELATGIPTLRPESDLDLLLRVPTPMTQQQAQALLHKLDRAPCRLDIQLETPLGGVALREWAHCTTRVLLKRASGACLVTNPWQTLENVA